MLRRARKEGRKFLNPVPTTIGGLGTIFKVLPRFLSNKEEKSPRRPLGPFRTDVSVYGMAPESGLRVTWMGHSSMLLEIDGVRVLIDPVWDERASPSQWAGPKRFFAAPVRLEDLPGVDVVLVSHDHYDHLGEATIRRLAGLESMRGAQWVTSLGVGESLREFGVDAERIPELDWTESVAVEWAGDYGGAFAALFRAGNVQPVRDALVGVCAEGGEAYGLLWGGFGVVGGVRGDWSGVWAVRSDDAGDWGVR